MENTEVVINNKLDPVVTLYHNGIMLGKIKSDTAMMDVLAQIHVKCRNGEDTDGYYVKWGRKKIDIEPYGRVKNPPVGFFDSYSKSLDIVFDIDQA